MVTRREADEYQCEGELCVANADGSGDVQRLAADGGDPSWAPDSQRLVFEHYLYGGTVYGSEPQSLSLVGLGATTLGSSRLGP